MSAKNLPFSTTDVKRVVNSCPICAEIKPQFHRGVNNTLIKATHPMERLSINFKGPFPSSSNNKCLFIVIDKYSRFPFAFPYKEMTSLVVINCLDKLFTLCGMPCFVHSDNGPCSFQVNLDITFSIGVLLAVNLAFTILLAMVK